MKVKNIFLLVIGLLMLPMSCTHKEVEESKTTLVGAYGKETKPTTEETALFANAAKGKSCEGWIPIKVSKQVVAGLNYAFKCKDKSGKVHTVKVFRPLPGRGEPQVTAIDE